MRNRNKTMRQLLNSVDDTAPKTWTVTRGWEISNLAKSEPMTYRQAKAEARLYLNKGGYAIVDRAA